jgi:hypothetical protein
VYETDSVVTEQHRLMVLKNKWLWKVLKRKEVSGDREKLFN